MADVRVKSGSDLSREIQECLTEARGRTFDALKAAVDKTAQETVKNTREKSPRRTGVYQKNWAAKQDNSGILTSGVYGKTVYQKKKPSLTHLLQNGHEITGYLQGKGRSRTREFDHIQSDEVTEQILTKNFEREMDRG